MSLATEAIVFMKTCDDPSNTLNPVDAMLIFVATKQVFSKLSHWMNKTPLTQNMVKHYEVSYLLMIQDNVQQPSDWQHYAILPM